MKPFELNELPSFSPWVAELLNDRACKREKNEEQIQREFGCDKWGALLARWKKNPCSIDEVRCWVNSPELMHPALTDEGLMLMTASEAHDCYSSLVEDALLESPSKHLVEVGCGFGSILFELLKRNRVNYESVMGLEYTPQGVELTRSLAQWHSYDVAIGSGDYNVAGLSDLEVRPESDILSSYSFHYVRDSSLAIDNLINLRPRRVLHFEPILQHYRKETILGLLQQRYLELNDYNVSLLDELKKRADKGQIEILKEVPMAFGSNCLLPASLLVWRVKS